ncbi:MAG TPA: ferrochelatase [Thioploca sp.]|nr:ferrochelatase [Thioploca sp.]
MTIYNNSTYNHKNPAQIGVLLVNLGTPDAPTTSALRNYLGEFLADPRITEMPRWLWRLILHGVILRIRPSRSAKKYQQIWTEAGSPLLEISKIQLHKLQQVTDFNRPITIALGMRYGNPSIAAGLEQLRQANARYILILPLYPQYSSTSTGSVFDAVNKVFKTWRWLPDVRFISHYHDHPVYINALTTQIKRYWAEHGTPDKLLFSFHGIPKRFFLNGDPYYCECQKTARLVAEQIDVPSQVVFQSRFGKEEWLKPYTDKTLIELGKEGLKRVDIICPGFATDCVETLEEIDHENRQFFLQAGGKEFHYIPALNSSIEHIQLLSQLIIQHTQGWNPESDNKQFTIFTEHKKTSQI